MDHIVDTIIKLRKMTKPPSPDYVEKNEEIGRGSKDEKSGEENPGVETIRRDWFNKLKIIGSKTLRKRQSLCVRVHPVIKMLVKLKKSLKRWVLR